MKRLVFSAAVVALITACGPDNPFGPDNPSPSALTGVVSGSTPTTAKLSWNAVPDSDFSSYSLYRSSTSGIQNNPGSAAIIAVITDKGSTVYFDENLTPGAVWYYVIKISNEGGGVSWSNEVNVKLPSR